MKKNLLLASAIFNSYHNTENSAHPLIHRSITSKYFFLSELQISEDLSLKNKKSVFIMQHIYEETVEEGIKTVSLLFLSISQADIP